MGKAKQKSSIEIEWTEVMELNGLIQKSTLSKNIKEAFDSFAGFHGEAQLNLINKNEARLNGEKVQNKVNG